MAVLQFKIRWLKKKQILSEPEKRGSTPAGVWKAEGAATGSLLCAERPGGRCVAVAEGVQATVRELEVGDATWRGTVSLGGRCEDLGLFF